MAGELATALQFHSAEFGVNLQTHWVYRCECHFALLQKWQQRISLTRYRDLDEYARWGYLEGLFVANTITAKTVVDVGAGAGLPGVAMALARTDTAFVWLEPRMKRWAFLKEIVRELELRNVSVLRTRFEDFDAPAEAFYFVRALDQFGEHLDELVRLASERQGLAVLAGDRVRESLLSKSAHFEIDVLPIPTSESRYLVVLRTRR